MTAFTDFAESSTELANWLGIDGSLTVDIGDDSHLWNSDNTLTPPDEGTLAVVNTDLTQNNGGVHGTDSEFAFGQRNLIQYDFPDDRHLSMGGFAIPNPGDGTRSAIIGIIGQVDAVPADPDGLRSILADGGPDPGWFLFAFDAMDRLRFTLNWAPGAEQTSAVGSANSYQVGDPFLAIANIEFQGAELKLATWTPNLGFDFVTTALTDFGSFASTSNIVVGSLNPHIANWAGLDMQWAQIFSFQYLGTLDAEFGLPNVQRFMGFAGAPAPPVRAIRRNLA